MAHLILANHPSFLLQKKVTTFGHDFADGKIETKASGIAFTVFREENFFLLPGSAKVKVNGVAATKKISLAHCDRLEWDGGVAVFVDSALPASVETKNALSSLQILQDLAFRLQREGAGSVHQAFEAIVEAAGADEGFLLSELNRELEWHLVASKSSNEELKSRKALFSNTILRDALEKRSPVYVESIIGHPYAEADSVVLAKVFSVACFPLIVQEEIIGAVFLYTRTPGKSIQKDRLPELNLLATQVALLLSLAARKPAPLPAGSNTMLFEKNSPMAEVQEKVRKLASTPLNILVHGETGAGKELVARALHFESARKNGPFVAVNCAAIPATLLESTLFGHERGAFTGAVRAQEGKFSLAHKGTLFLDEIADLPLDLQSKILRVIQEKLVEPLGSNRAVPVDVRVVAATHQNLELLISQKKFRQDLYYRLHGARITLPALRERTMDIPLLAKFFLSAHGKSFSPDCLEHIQKYPWPGNVRELEQVVTRAAYLAEGKVIEPKDLDLDLKPEFLDDKEEFWDSLTLSDAQTAFTRSLVEKTLHKLGSRQKTALHLGISERTLYRILADSSATLD